MSFSGKISVLLKEHGITKAQLAKAAGIPYTTLDSMLKRESDTGRLASIFKIADFLGVTVEELVFDRCSLPRMELSDEETRLVGMFRASDDRSKDSIMNMASYESMISASLYSEGNTNASASKKKRTKMLPVYDAPAAAGAALPLLNDDYAMTWAENAPDDASFGIKIRGDSMIPLIENGAVVWVKKQNTLDHGEIGIFVLNGESLCKRLEYRNGDCFLISMNPAYDPIKIYETDDLKVAGKVILQ